MTETMYLFITKKSYLFIAGGPYQFNTDPSYSKRVQGAGENRGGQVAEDVGAVGLDGVEVGGREEQVDHVPPEIRVRRHLTGYGTSYLRLIDSGITQLRTF